MALSVSLHKVDETSRYCLYDFGSGEAVAGRVKLYTDSGDVEVVHLSNAELPARPPFYLSQAVPRLREYQAQDRYPSRDQWTV